MKNKNKKKKHQKENKDQAPSHPALFVMFSHDRKPQITLKLTHRGASRKPFTSSMITHQ